MPFNRSRKDIRSFHLTRESIPPTNLAKMPKKNPQILKKAMNLLTISIPIHKLRKPINSSLLLFKRTRKIKHLELLKHYNYTYIEEYQFSPSSTPLFSGTPSKNRRRRHLYSMFLLCRCSGNSSGGEEEEEVYEDDEYALEEKMGDTEDEVETESGTVDSQDSEEEGDSVDQRAEKFINRFYEEMRIQRQESLLEYKEMLDRGSE
ncbi:hypothetical protein ACLOJK_001293 [Asimina triloba]